MLFSATLHGDCITDMSNKICSNPTWVDLKGKEYVPDTVHHCIVVNPNNDNQWRYNNNETRNIITDGVHQRDRIQYNDNNNNIPLNDLTISQAI